MSNKKGWINSYFSDDELSEIQSAIDRVEQTTIGEIVLSVRSKRSFLEKLYTPHELAWKDFNRLGVANTKERTGVLIFILFEEKYYDIIADEGLYSKISNDVWNELEEKLKSGFKENNYADGILSLIEKIGEILKNEFPSRAGADNDDEIKNEVVIN